MIFFSPIAARTDTLMQGPTNWKRAWGGVYCRHGDPKETLCVFFRMLGTARGGGRTLTPTYRPPTLEDLGLA